MAAAASAPGSRSPLGGSPAAAASPCDGEAEDVPSAGNSPPELARSPPELTRSVAAAQVPMSPAQAPPTPMRVPPNTPAQGCPTPPATVVDAVQAAADALRQQQWKEEVVRDMELAKAMAGADKELAAARAATEARGRELQRALARSEAHENSEISQAGRIATLQSEAAKAQESQKAKIGELAAEEARMNEEVAEKESVVETRTSSSKVRAAELRVQIHSAQARAEEEAEKIEVAAKEARERGDAWETEGQELVETRGKEKDAAKQEMPGPPTPKRPRKAAKGKKAAAESAAEDPLGMHAAVAAAVAAAEAERTEAQEKLLQRLVDAQKELQVQKGENMVLNGDLKALGGVEARRDALVAKAAAGPAAREEEQARLRSAIAVARAKITGDAQLTVQEARDLRAKQVVAEATMKDLEKQRAAADERAQAAVALVNDAAELRVAAATAEKTELAARLDASKQAAQDAAAAANDVITGLHAEKLRLSERAKELKADITQSRKDLKGVMAKLVIAEPEQGHKIPVTPHKREAGAAAAAAAEPDAGEAAEEEAAEAEAAEAAKKEEAKKEEAKKAAAKKAAAKRRRNAW